MKRQKRLCDCVKKSLQCPPQGRRDFVCYAYNERSERDIINQKAQKLSEQHISPNAAVQERQREQKRQKSRRQRKKQVGDEKRFVFAAADQQPNQAEHIVQNADEKPKADRVSECPKLLRHIDKIGHQRNTLPQNEPCCGLAWSV